VCVQKYKVKNTFWGRAVLEMRTVILSCQIKVKLFWCFCVSRQCLSCEYVNAGLLEQETALAWELREKWGAKWYTKLSSLHSWWCSGLTKNGIRSMEMASTFLYGCWVWGYVWTLPNLFLWPWDFTFLDSDTQCIAYFQFMVLLWGSVSSGQSVLWIFDRNTWVNLY
jgi:hypothetical protein